MADKDIPEWLTDDYLKFCLESDSENFPEVTVIKHTVEPAVAPGNNYGSHMLRVKVHYKVQCKSSEEKSINLIVKAPLTDKYMEALSDMLSKEPKYYIDFIQETYKLSKHDIVPKAYMSPSPKCLVMEDLKTAGYEMVDRTKLLDLEHARTFIKASAKLHALSIAVHKQNPELVESLGTETAKVTESWNEVNRSMMRKGLMCVSTFLSDKPHYKEQVDVMNRLIEGDKLWRLYNELETTKWDVNSLAQLDPWCTNMMFKYDSARNVVGVKLIDFQSTRYTTPLFEFFTFLWCSVRPDVRNLERDSLYRLYCDSFNTSLAEFGCPERLALEYVKSMTTDFAPLVLMVVCCFVPFSLHEGVTDVEDFMNGKLEMEDVKESNIYKVYQDPVFDTFIPQVIDELTELGVFKYLLEKLNHK